MAVRSLKLSELTGLTLEDQKEQIEQFSKSLPLNGELESLQARLAEFERCYEMSSKTMLSRFKSGDLNETAEIGQWLILLSIRDGIATDNV